MDTKRIVNKLYMVERVWREGNPSVLLVGM